MQISEIGKLPPLERFLYWCRERHQISLKKEAGLSKPWTNDEVLQRYFFTNPYRENDKVTQWFRTHVREPMQNDPQVLFATICFRWFNWPPTGMILLGENLLTQWDTRRAVEILSRQERVFTGAFNISNSGSTKPKVNRVCEDYIQSAWEASKILLLKIATTGIRMEQAHRLLLKLPGMGGSGFMAYEVICDLRYTYLLREAPDKETWSNPGPGAKRGLNRLLNRPLNNSCKDYQQKSRELLLTCHEKLSRMPRFEMREVEHSLCEFDKYERARLGDGHIKRRYRGA